MSNNVLLNYLDMTIVFGTKEGQKSCRLSPKKFKIISSRWRSSFCVVHGCFYRKRCGDKKN